MSCSAKSPSAGAGLAERARAKVNLTLFVVGRRPDGYHELESLVVFARLGDRLQLCPGETLGLEVRGEGASKVGAVSDNLVLKAADEFARRVRGALLGQFLLWKNLPVAAGLGGGSADAAAALRLLARANALAPDDERLPEAALATGADVPVCLQMLPRVMAGIGEVLSEPIDLPPLPAVLVNPRVTLATSAVFAALHSRWAGASAAVPRFAVAGTATREQIFAALGRTRNDLEPPALALCPVIADVLHALTAQPGCGLSRMSGSGATCVGLFAEPATAARAARRLSADHPDWWVRATTLGDMAKSGRYRR